MNKIVCIQIQSLWFLLTVSSFLFIIQPDNIIIVTGK